MSPSANKSEQFNSEKQQTLFAVSHIGHVCFLTQQTCLSRHTGDTSLVSHSGQFHCVTHSRHVCCVTEPTCLLRHKADPPPSHKK